MTNRMYLAPEVSSSEEEAPAPRLPQLRARSQPLPRLPAPAPSLSISQLEGGEPAAVEKAPKAKKARFVARWMDEESV